MAKQRYLLVTEQLSPQAVHVLADVQDDPRFEREAHCHILLTDLEQLRPTVCALQAPVLCQACARA